MTHTDVDTTGKSYYGETNLYLVAVDGSFDGLVDMGESYGVLHGSPLIRQTRRDRSMILFGALPLENLPSATDVSPLIECEA